jgi:hypothetical protein
MSGDRARRDEIGSSDMQRLRNAGHSSSTTEQSIKPIDSFLNFLGEPGLVVGNLPVSKEGVILV